MPTGGLSPPYLATALISILLIGCNRKANIATGRPTVPAGTCVVHGTVKFVGTAPEAKPISGTCCPGSSPVMDESLIVNANGTMKNIVVFIQNGPNVDIGPMTDRVLAQKDCQYAPHVLALRTRQTVVVTNHDATLHNVLTQTDANPAANIEESQGAAHPFSFMNPDIVKFKCSVHPWMTAYAYVFDHPCFAVTGEDGTFEIAHLPAGTYTLMAWQEKLGTQQMQIKVAADKPTEANFEYHGN